METTANQDIKNSTPWKPYSQVIANERKYIAGRIIDPSKVEGGSNVMFYGAYSADKEVVEKLCNELNEVPEWAENAKDEGFTYRPAKHLPDGWGWRDFHDGSGSLVSPEGDSVISYDTQTNEYKMDGKWNFMDDTGLDREYFEKLALSKYVQIATANEALASSLSEKGYVDMRYMESLTGKPCERLLSELKGTVFLNIGSASDQTKTYVTADEYLSGNISEKLAQAKAAQTTLNDGSFDVNVTALEAAIQRNENQKERENMSKYDLSARVNPLNDQSGRVKAMANITIDNVIAINSLTIVEGNNGNMFVGYPQTKDKENNYRNIVEFLKDENGKMTQESVDLKDAIQKLLVDMHENGERATPEVDEQDKVPVMHEVKAFVTPLRESENATRGLATVQIGQMFKINSVRVNENTKEGSENFGKNFVAMPSRPDKTAESGYRDVVHPVNAEFSEKLRGVVLKQYDNQLAWKENAAKKEQSQQREKPAANKSAQDIA